MKRLSIKLSGAEKSLGERIVDVFRRGAIVGSGVLVLGGGLSGCTQIQGQENTTTTSISTETTTNPDLKDVAPERLEFTKDLLNLYDKSLASYDPAFDKIKDFVSRDQVIKYGETGETGNNLSIVKNKDGSPAVALINCNNNVTNGFKDMINKMSKYDSNYLKKLTDNGMRVFMVNRFLDEGDTFFFNESGLVVWNLEDQNTKYLSLERPVLTEAFGIKMLQLGGDYAKYAGFIKEQLSSDCWWNLYKTTGEKICEAYSASSYMNCKEYYNEFYAPVDFRDKEIQDLINSARKLVSLFGGTEPEISKSIVDRPDFTGKENF